MKLEILLTGVAIQQQLGADVDVRNIQFDSRLVESGDLFVATRGTATDGHDYINKAIEQGAVAVICETMPEHKPESVVFVQVASSIQRVAKDQLAHSPRTSQMTIVL